VAVKIRIMGRPVEVTQVITVLNDADSLDVIEVSAPYPNRGDSRMVRVYLEAQAHADSRAAP
jgi:hypothetical protein